MVVQRAPSIQPPQLWHLVLVHPQTSCAIEPPPPPTQTVTGGSIAAPDHCLATGGGGGSFWGCLRTGQATHPPKLTHPPTHPDPPLLPQ